ncbi:MAG TPA: Crp/Fnr family transcriptional regulator [Spirochaetota bacterium]
MNYHDQLISHLSGILPPSHDEIDRIIRIFTRKLIRKDEYFIRADDTVEYIGFINKGLFRYFYIDFEGNEKTKYFVRDNDFVFSISSFIEHTPSFFFIEALSDSELMVIDANTLSHLLDSDTYWQTIYRRLLEKSYVIKEKREAEFLLYDAKDRYMHFIREYPDISSHVKQHHIASYLGIAPESLSRIRGQLGYS